MKTLPYLAAFLSLSWGPALHASFDGSASAGYKSPFSVHDGGGNTQNSATKYGRASIGASAQGPVAASAGLRLFPGYLQRLPLPSPSSTQTPSFTATPSSTVSPTLTATPSRSATASRTASSTPTSSPSATVTLTASPSPTATATPTASPSLSATVSPSTSPSCSPSSTPTAFAQLQLSKQAFPAFVTVAGDPILFVLTLQNTGDLAATSVTLWDSLPSNASYLSDTGGGVYSGGLLSWSLASLAPAATVSFSFTTSFTGSGTQVDNLGSAMDADHGQVDSNAVHVGVSQPLTATETPSSTETATASQSPSCTLTSSETDVSTLSSTESPTATPTATPTETLSSSPTETGTETATDTPSSTLTPSSTATLSASPSPSLSATPTASATPTPSASITAPFSPSSSATPTASPSPSFSATPTASPSATPTPLAPGLSVVKSAAESQAFQDSLIHYSIVVSNAGPGDAQGVQVYDSLPDGTNFFGPGTVQGNGYGSNDAWRFSDALALARGPFDLSVGQSVTLSLVVKLAFPVPGENLSNTAQALDPRFDPGAFGSAYVPMLSGAASPTPSPSPSPVLSASPTPVQTALPPPLQLSMVRDQGQPWVGGADLRFSINIANSSSSPVSDLVLQFDSDLDNQNQFLDFLEPNTLLGPTDPMSPVAWRLASVGIDQGVDMGQLSVAAASSLTSPRRIFTTVMGGQGSTLTSQVVLSSASLGLAVTATVQTYINDGAPSPAVAPPQPSSTATPLADLGRIVAYPQPANDHLCFAFRAPVGGALRILVYNAAFQLAAEFMGNATGSASEHSCADISGLAPGVYFYRASVGDFAFPTGQFGVVR